MSSGWVEVTVNWLEGMQFSGKNTKGGEIVFGSKKEKPGIAPMELLLVGLAGCTGVDVVHILKKKRQSLDDLQVKVRAKTADEHPKVYTNIEITYLIWGVGISEKAVIEAINLSEEKYCSATIMLGKTAEIISTYEINPPG